MSLSVQDIEHIARLARLSLSEAEKTMYAAQLSTVLDYIGMLQEVDTDGVEETHQVTGLSDVFREDVVTPSRASRDALVSQFPKKKGDLLEVKGVFDA